LIAKDFEGLEHSAPVSYRHHFFHENDPISSSPPCREQFAFEERPQIKQNRRKRNGFAILKNQTSKTQALNNRAFQHFLIAPIRACPGRTLEIGAVEKIL
jgi:hypothetical protein